MLQIYARMFQIVSYDISANVAKKQSKKISEGCSDDVLGKMNQLSCEV